MGNSRIDVILNSPSRFWRMFDRITFLKWQHSRIVITKFANCGSIFANVTQKRAMFWQNPLICIWTFGHQKMWFYGTLREICKLCNNFRELKYANCPWQICYSLISTPPVHVAHIFYHCKSSKIISKSFQLPCTMSILCHVVSGGFSLLPIHVPWFWSQAQRFCACSLWRNNSLFVSVSLRCMY